MIRLRLFTASKSILTIPRCLIRCGQHLNLGIQVVSSELTLLETLTGAFKRNDPQLIADYEKVLTASEMKLIPITAGLLRQAARLRTTINLKTPDAIHAATALALGCVQLITNDTDLKRVTALDVAVLSEIV